MPRIRTIKPDFWDSQDTAAADLRTRLLFIAMWNWADDYGIGDATPVRVIGFAFPNDDIAASDYPRLLADVSRVFGVVFFEHKGRPFYAIPTWSEHQRTEKKAKPREGLVEAAAKAVEGAKPAGERGNADVPADGGGLSEESRGCSGAGSRNGGKGNGGTGEECVPLPDEPPDDDYVPTEIGTSARPTAQQPTSMELTFIRTHIGQKMPRNIETQLVVKARPLIRDHGREPVEAALHEWGNRTGASPGLLPNLVSDHLRKGRTQPPASKIRELDTIARALEAQERQEIAQ